MKVKAFHTKLIVLAENLNFDITPLTALWWDIYSKREKSRGREDAVKFMKELNTCGERYALHQPVTPLPWTKSSKDGFPKVIKAFKPWLRSESDFKVILALSVLRSVESLRLPISKDISTVTAPSCADPVTVDEVIRFIPKFLRRINIPLGSMEMKYHPSLKNGPNGHAILESDKDISAVMKTPKILCAIHRVEGRLRDKYPMEMSSKLLFNNPGALHSKLTQFPEKAGKTRTIAVIDYYSQRCLKPLHSGIMNILRRLVSDGTYSHTNVGKYAQQKTKEKSFIYCCDLSAATDRFPKQIQKQMLFELVKDDYLARALWTLLAERTFTVAWSRERVTYNCGQPMGAYSSWPLFALSHHLVIEYVASQLRIKSPKKLYRLIGDDVIITDQRLATGYEKVMLRLGLDINYSKTVVTPRHAEKSGAEVAKQVFLNGRNLTPLTPGFIQDVMRPYMFNTCLDIMKVRYNLESEIPSMLINSLFRKEKTNRLVWLLCSDPLSGSIKPGDPGYNNYSPWKNKNLFLVERLVLGIGLLARLQNKADRVKELLDQGPPWKEEAGPSRASKYVLRYIREELEDKLQKLFPGNDLSKSFLEIANSVAYLPDVEAPFMERKQKVNRRLSDFKEWVFLETPDLPS